jgi:uncharacterized protein YbjT (DUF2867 family)
MSKQKTALIIGSTGLTGSHLLEQLLASNYYGRVVALVRRPLEQQHPKLASVVFDFEQPDAALVQCDDVFCCLGTTLKKAGSKEAQYRIDHNYPLLIGRLAKQQGATQYILVSSVGADAGSGNFYLRTKGELERDLEALGFDTFISLRPSFLLGERQETRLGERIGIAVAGLLSPLMVGGLRKYRGVEAAQVASTMIRLANADITGRKVVEDFE